MSYRGRQAEDRLLGHKALSKIHIVLKIWKVFHVDPNLQMCKHGHLVKCIRSNQSQVKSSQGLLGCVK